MVLAVAAVGVALVLAGCPVPLSQIGGPPGSAPLGSLVMVENLWDAGSGAPEELITYNGLLVFSAQNSEVGRELFAYNGSSINLVADIQPGAVGSEPGDFIVYQGDLYFSATTSGAGEELWRFDGSNVEMVYDLDPGPGDGLVGLNAVEYDGYLLFNGTDSSFTHELFYYYPTFSQPYLLEDINPLGSGHPSDFAILDGTLYFYAEADAYGAELFRLTSLFATVDVAAHRVGYNLLPRELTVYDGMLYFGANANAVAPYDYQLHSYDPSGTGSANTRGTSIVDLTSSPTDDAVRELYVYNGELFFRGFNGVNTLMYKYDGTTVTTIGSAGQTPSDFQELDGKLFFSASTAAEGRELWVYRDGVAELVDDAVPGSGGSAPSYLTVYNNQLYFSAESETGDIELFRLSTGI
jgi:ELWxxDGT repeat protein